MASNQVNINLNLQDQSKSIKQRTDEVKGLNKELQKSQEYATGTKSGSKAVAASYSAAGQNIEYGRARGSMGATGASGRDFANQAQGLGGLVRLYATYAANIFAVSAAFRSLSDAMDTTNMVKGLDQLGAASGVAMGSLAKQFTEASGGAISLRESMEATAKAISSGMSQKQFLQLGDVAKKASQALGVNMSDAVSRLTRGITKLEPELLDELGLFTKVGKASEDYARSVGKSVDSLTDFEKRQAFANAVLKEGIDKFNEIDIPTNPYDKLLASLKNIAQTILEVLNKALGPLVNILSASPAALTAGIAALGAMILKQAIPTITNYREELRKTAEMSSKLTGEKLGQAQNILAKRRADILARQDAAAQASSDAIDKLESKLRGLSGGRIRKDIAEILTPTRGIQDITENEIQKIEKAGKALKTNTNVYTELAGAIRAAQLEQQKYNIVAAKLKAEETAPLSIFSAPGRLVASAEAQRKRSASSSIISQAADTASLVGFRSAFVEMIDSLKTEKLGALRTVFTGLTATVTAAATRLMGFVGMLGQIGMVVGIVIGVFQGLSYAFSTNAKEVDKFSKSLELGDENSKALLNTYNKYKQALTSDSVIALSTSFQNLSDNLDVTVKAFKDAIEEASAFDRTVNSLKNVFGQGLEADFAKGVSKQVSQGLKGILDPSLKKDTEAKLKSLLNINELSDRDIKESLSSMSASRLITIGEEIANTFEKASKAGQKTGATLMAIKDGFKALEVSYTELSNTLIQKDALSDFGKNLATQGFNLTQAFKDPIANLANLRDLLTDISKIKLLAPDSQAIIMQNRDAYIALINAAKEYESQIVGSENRIESIKKEVGKSNTGLIGRDVIAAEKEKIKVSQDRLKETRDQMNALGNIMSKAAEASITKGFQLIEGGFTRKMAETVLSSQKSLLDKLPQTAETAKLGAKLENQKIDLQIQQITETQRLIKELELSRLQSEKQFLETRRDEALKTATEETRAAVTKAPEARIKEIENREKVLTSKNISADIKAGKLEKTPETLKALQEQKGTMSQVAQLQQQKVMNNVGAEITGVQLTYDKTKKTVEDILKGVTATKEEEMKSEAFRKLSLAEQQDIVGAYLEQEDSLKRSLNTLELNKELAVSLVVEKEAERNKWWEIYDVALRTQETTQKQLQVTDGIFVRTTATATAERLRAESLARSTLELTKYATKLEGEYALTNARVEIENNLTGVRRDSLQTQLELGVITAENFRTETIALEQAERLKQRDIKLDQLKANLTITQIGLIKELMAATNADDIQNIQQKMSNASRLYETQVDGIRRVYTEQEKTKALTDNLSARQIAYGQVFANSFKAMEDAIVNFTKTGKLSFSDMINSFLEGLLRYEIQQQQMMLYKGIGGLPGIFSFLTGTPTPNAKGGVYDTGLQTFAKGGMFTNSIVDSPTLFKFAKGTGLMGEAGPEAIMPLKRDSNGNLGVRAAGGGGNVDVVVNNYGSQQATTKETTDSRGNRKIEVIIGDMVAGELNRVGSTTQQAMTASYGTAPLLARR